MWRTLLERGDSVWYRHHSSSLLISIACSASSCLCCLLSLFVEILRYSRTSRLRLHLYRIRSLLPSPNLSLLNEENNLALVRENRICIEDTYIPSSCEAQMLPSSILPSCPSSFVGLHSLAYVPHTRRVYSVRQRSLSQLISEEVQPANIPNDDSSTPSCKL